MSKQRKKMLCIFTTLLLIGALTSCSDDSSSTSTATTTMESDLNTVEGDMLPASLQTTAAGDQRQLSKLHELAKAARTGKATRSGDNPCEGYSFMGCQPILLRMYLEIANMTYGIATEVITQVGTALGNLEDGASGSTAIGTSTLDYEKTNATTFSFLLKAGDDTPFMYANKDGSIYNIKLDLGNMPSDFASEEDDGTGGSLELVLDFTDANTWNLTVTIADMECAADDIGAPEHIKIVINKSNGLWTGKAMMHHPRWVDSDNYTCSTTPSDATSVSIYTDFVADEAAAKANVYLLDRTTTAVSSTYEIQNYCTNYLNTLYGGVSSSCNGLFSTQGGSTTADDYALPFCNPAGTDAAEWDSDCTSHSSTVSAANFGATTDWVAPDQAHQMSVTLPTSL